VRFGSRNTLMIIGFVPRRMLLSREGIPAWRLGCLSADVHNCGVFGWFSFEDVTAQSPDTQREGIKSVAIVQATLVNRNRRCDLERVEGKRRFVVEHWPGVASCWSRPKGWGKPVPCQSRSG
jgi:hypothetical protein